MPKYKITEQDNTGVTELAEQPNVVYIPGASASSSKTEPKTYSTLAEFLKDAEIYAEDKSFLLAIRLLKLGMQVVYQGFPLVSGSAVITDNVFTIDDITYTYVPETNKITYTDKYGFEHESFVDDNHVVKLDKDILAKIIVATGSGTVTYPVATRSASVVINEENKFIARGIEFEVIANNTLRYIINDSTYTAVGNNGVFVIATGVTESFTITVDYVHEKAFYVEVFVSEGSINISDDDWKLLEDRNMFNIRFLTTGGYACPSETMISTAANRGDCVALIDHPNYEDYSVGTVRAFVESLKGATSRIQKDPLSFASAFTPWFTARIEDASGQSVEEEVPASFGYLFAFARSIQSNPIWKASAGVKRGVIPELVDISKKLNNAECEMLGARATTMEVDLDAIDDNVGIAINPIAYRRYSGFGGGFNYVVYGNRTMHVNDGKCIATSFLGTRILVTELNKALYDASVVNTFEQNSDVMWIEFKSLITPLLNKMQSGEGIEGYRIDKAISTKRARVKAVVTISPIDGAEDFELDISIADSVTITE